MKKLGFGLMRLPVRNGKPEDIDIDALCEMVDTFLMPSADKVDTIFEEQLNKCGVEYFDYYLLHNLNRTLYDTEVKDAQLFEH